MILYYFYNVIPNISNDAMAKQFSTAAVSPVCENLNFHDFWTLFALYLTT